MTHSFPALCWRCNPKDKCNWTALGITGIFSILGSVLELGSSIFISISELSSTTPYTYPAYNYTSPYDGSINTGPAYTFVYGKVAGGIAALCVLFLNLVLLYFSSKISSVGFTMGNNSQVNDGGVNGQPVQVLGANGQIQIVGANGQAQTTDASQVDVQKFQNFINFYAILECINFVLTFVYGVVGGDYSWGRSMCLFGTFVLKFPLALSGH
jgi:hypothetical protein